MLTSQLYFRCAARDGSGNEAVGDPCTPQGLAGAEGDTNTAVNAHPTVPMGNFTACRAESLALLQQGRGVWIWCMSKSLELVFMTIFSQLEGWHLL